MTTAGQPRAILRDRPLDRQHRRGLSGTTTTSPAGWAPRRSATSCSCAWASPRICPGTPCSTIRPWDITRIRSARSAATPRSWVTRSTLVPDDRVSSAMLSRICRWTVTSSALVGSSAITSSGLATRAMAISTRCRIPPDSSCGYCRARSSGRSMPAAASAATASCAAVRFSARPWIRSTSATCRPIGVTGLSDTVGSCGITPICRPRIDRHSRRPALRRSRPRK